MTHNIDFCRHVLAEDDCPADDREYAQGILDAWEETRRVYSASKPKLTTCQLGEQRLDALLKDCGPLPVDAERFASQEEILQCRDILLRDLSK